MFHFHKFYNGKRQTYEKVNPTEDFRYKMRSQNSLKGIKKSPGNKLFYESGSVFSKYIYIM